MLSIAPLPPRLAFYHPAVLVGTWFGVGRQRPFSGTLASLVATLLAWPIMEFGGRFVLGGAALAIFILGWWASAVYSEAAGESDPASVVVDEVAGQWLVLLAAPFSVWGFAAAFAAFRLYDILKPWPVDFAERRFRGPFGIMIDDVIASCYALIVVALIFNWLLV